MVNRQEFLADYIGAELDPEWFDRISQKTGKGWQNFVKKAESQVVNIREEIGELGEDTQLNLYGFGIGVTYYVMPLNLYIAGSLGAADANLQIDGETRELRDASGTAINLMVGKEWWVSDNWGLGVAAQYYRIDMEYANDGELDANAAGLLFSATFN